MSVAVGFEDGGGFDGYDYADAVGHKAVSVGGAEACGHSSPKFSRFENRNRQWRSLRGSEALVHFDKKLIGFVSGRVVLAPGQQG